VDRVNVSEIRQAAASMAWFAYNAAMTPVAASHLSNHVHLRVSIFFATPARTDLRLANPISFIRE